MSMLKRGSKGKDVTEIQARLQEVGFPPGIIDGDFGRATEIAVINFQKSQGLLADGIVGPKTLDVLFKGKDIIAKPKPVPININVKPEDITSRVTPTLVSKLFVKTNRVKKTLKSSFLPF